MSYKFKCFTLFDITKTGNTHRKNSTITNLDEQLKWQRSRNTQVNFDTVIQVISMRSLPENITDPVKELINLNEFPNFGFMFNHVEEKCYCWSFEFCVSHPSVFHDGINELGHLYQDCQSVPMLVVGTEWNKLPSFLDGSIELRNIYFEETKTIQAS